ncbi:hypothetical protein EKM02_00270 [Flavobacterium sp. RSP49]|uniref:hypothetical protein n=1 Tax=unclassified Flavobacterium TaxID=196869 RepID=UPI000F84C1C5|nr:MULTISPECIES: hypothetical protein [unclassified Flavobacterium]RTY88629.1 hypothetical protein EKM00_00270 [Flavobacterium sp. RSP15]RTZ03312.1 hypothetical protein EKM02_00270 [Flavobacterium sp. RSP49]
MQKVMNLIVNSCKKTTELMDKQLLTALSVKEKMQLQVHKTMCKTCSAYENQSKIIDSIICKWFTGSAIITVKLPEDKKAKIIEAIKEA